MDKLYKALELIQTYRAEVVAVLACTGLLLLVLELVRRNQIKEKYSFLWLLTGGSLLTLTFRRDWLAKLASFVGVYYPPAALFLVLIFFMIVILVHYSMVLSKLLTQNQKLAQKMALLEVELESQKKKSEKKAA